MTIRERHYANYDSPGTLFAEHSRRRLKSWSINEAIAASADIEERYGARPYAFYFTTMLESDPISDGRGGRLMVEAKEIRRSHRYYLGGDLYTLDGIENLIASGEDTKLYSSGLGILRDNMRANGWPIAVYNQNSYSTFQPFDEEDVVVAPDGTITHRGDDPHLVEYRAAKKAQREAEHARWRKEAGV